MLDFRVETFLTVCQTMNFTEAARLLHITQPAVSQHIHGLEKQFDAVFFQYEGKRLSFTAAGQLFYRTALAMRHDVDHLKQQLSQVDAAPVLNFGATLTVGEYIMPPMLLRLLKTRPEVRLRMLVENTDVLLKLLNQGEIDFAIVEGYFPRQTYEGLPFRTERFLPVCAPGAFPAVPTVSAISTVPSAPADAPVVPAAAPAVAFSSVPAAAPLPLEALLSCRLLVREAGSGTREILERSLREHNLALSDFPKLTELGNLNVIKTLVMAGLGISFCYESVVREELADGRLQEIPVEGFPVTHDFTFLWQKDSVFSEYYRSVFETLCPG